MKRAKQEILFFIILGQLFLWSCVKQEEQASCKENEVFNSAINSCVQLLKAVNSDIKIISSSPSQRISFFKNSTEEILLSVTIENPQSETFTAEWTRNYLGEEFPFEGNELSATFIPADYSTLIGDHQITLKIKSSDVVLASETFIINLMETPVPIISINDILPAIQTKSIIATDNPEVYSIKVLNNDATIEGLSYEGRWIVKKNDVQIHTETYPFTNVDQTGINTFLLGTAVSPYFDPEVLGIGTYDIIFSIYNSESVDPIASQSWRRIVQHPPLSPVVSRNLFSSDLVKNFQNSTVAFHNIAYNTSPTFNFIPLSTSTQADFCVEIQNGEGTYPADSKFVEVRFYLDNNPTPIYSAFTSSIDKKICLSDPASIKSNIKFINANADSIETHVLKARVFDEKLNQEYSSENMYSGLGQYPIVWNLKVKPTNSAPQATLPSELPLKCAKISPIQANCEIKELEEFKFGVNLQDDFYNPQTDLDKFEYTMNFNQVNNSFSPYVGTLFSCSKLRTDISLTDYPLDDYIGPNYYCDHTIPTYNSQGPINPTTVKYKVVINSNDTGSPLSATQKSSSVISYNYVVKEINTTPTLIAQDPLGLDNSVSYIFNSTSPTVPILSIDEGESFKFNIKLSDNERDHFYYAIYRCLDSTCLIKTSTITPETLVLKSNGNLENEIISSQVNISESWVNKDLSFEDFYFLVEARDAPHTLSSSKATPIIFKLTINNINPAPYFTHPSDYSPAQQTLAANMPRVMTGFPYTMYSGAVSDDSIATNEKTVSFQWYANSGAGLDDYKKIQGATSNKLSWTPPTEASFDDVFKIKVCLHDGTLFNALPIDDDVASNNTICRGPWNLKSAPNIAKIFNSGATLGRTSKSLGTSNAIWLDSKDSTTNKKVVYVAYTDLYRINIDKAVINSDDELVTDDDTGFRTVTFNAIRNNSDPGLKIQDLTLSGNKDFLMIAYRTYTTDPEESQIHLRKIDKRHGVIDSINHGVKPTPSYPHRAKFGYTYETDLLTTNVDQTFNPTTGLYSRIYINPVYFNGNPLSFKIRADLGLDLVPENQPSNGDPGDYLEVNGVRFKTDEYDNVVDFCPGVVANTHTFCDQYSDEINITNFISDFNTNTNRGIQGLSATFDEDPDYDFQTKIWGATGGNYFDVPTEYYMTNKLGDIMVSTIDGEDYWILPFLSSSGANANKIVLLASNIDNILWSEMSIEEIVLSDVSQVISFTNQLYTDIDSSSTKMAFGIVSDKTISSVFYPSSASLHLYNISLSNSIQDFDSINLFENRKIEPSSLEFSLPQKLTIPTSSRTSTNPYFYTVAKVLSSSTYAWWIGKYDKSLANPKEFRMATIATTGTNTSNILSLNHLKDVNLITYVDQPISTESNHLFEEARLMVSSTYGNTNSNLYAIKFSSTNKLSCGDCQKLNPDDLVLSSFYEISSTPIFANYQIGDDGFNNNENIREIVFTNMATANPDTDDVCIEYDCFLSFKKPRLGIFNLRSEDLSGRYIQNPIPTNHRSAIIPKLPE